MKSTHTIALVSSILASTLVLAGCTSQAAAPSSSPSASVEVTSDFNAADEMFVTMMIPHHEQAVEMADIILDKDEIDPRVTELAQEVKDAQGPEIETMRGWLDQWGVEYDDGSMGGMDHGDGMMTEDDLGALEAAQGAEASRLFLEQMIMHHEGAIEMAEVEVDSGMNPEAVSLAEQVVADQSAEIATMQELLRDL